MLKETATEENMGYVVFIFIIGYTLIKKLKRDGSLAISNLPAYPHGFYYPVQ